MNISKWVKFVLDEDLPGEQNVELYEIDHHLMYDPSAISESVLGDPRLIEKTLLSTKGQDPSSIEDVSVSYFEEKVVVSIKERVSKDQLFDLSRVELAAELLHKEGLLLTEASYNRMRQYGIYKFGCLIEYETTSGDARRGLDDIVSDIRAIPTVTIVSVVLANEKISTGRYVAGLQIKFIPSYPGSLAQPEDAKSFILRMIRKIKNVRGISRVTLKTDRIE